MVRKGSTIVLQLMKFGLKLVRCNLQLLSDQSDTCRSLRLQSPLPLGCSLIEVYPLVTQSTASMITESPSSSLFLLYIPRSPSSLIEENLPKQGLSLCDLSASLQISTVPPFAQPLSTISYHAHQRNCVVVLIEGVYCGSNFMQYL